MSELKILNVNGVECYEKDGTAYLKLETVARGLGFSRIATSGNEVVRWETVRKYLEELGVPTSWHENSSQVGKDGLPEFIPENIFYRLAMKAKNETAEKFQALIADEIIPSIRKNGGYIAGQETMTDDELLERAIFVAQRKIAERDKIIAQQKEKIEQDKPKAIFADAVSASHTSILIGELAKILKQNGIDVGQNRLFAWMRNQGYLISRKGTDYNMPTQRSMEQGLFEIKESTSVNPDGSIRTNKTPKVTGKGQQYFVNKFLCH
ncbi:MAG: phage antirepressor KilAC domain-containing protein [Muribaculaceae bacterium]|nr:phage antirepressor KilAC domain-containing protein [Muribaculaceae bacterium]MCM1399886.1 phage antirepressor KilAC domain-containing protein [Clostridium sp.]MCM1460628.1 phage antirepressor KilAC domain-containing protein [Bacteroides sp.]